MSEKRDLFAPVARRTPSIECVRGDGAVTSPLGTAATAEGAMATVAATSGRRIRASARRVRATPV